MTAYITRIAPSPTGHLHVGTARTALFSWLLAKATGGKFILRLDDTDTDRNMVEAEQPIFDGLKWLGLEWDRFYRQSERTDIYKSWACHLLNKGYAFEADNGAVILKWDNAFMPRSWTDEVVGEVPITETNIEQIDGRTVLLRGGDKLGQATYQFASVVDDYVTGVNYICRGTDHISNTAKQVAIWTALEGCEAKGKALPKFAHVGLIFSNKKKMSKRDGAASLLQYRDEGFHPDALFNGLLRMGWGPTVDDKTNSVLSRERAIELFIDGGRMRSANSNFDPVKLAWFDKMMKRGT
jgi:glutamyl/glutaminyl-tRNA synthetase